MINILATVILAAGIAAVALVISSWRKAYAAAKATDFPVFLSPVHLTDIWFMMISGLLVPLLNKLPSKWKNPWLPMAQVFNIWTVGYKPFEEAGTETFVLATPRGNLVWTCDAKVINQLETMHPKSQVAVDLVKFFEVYGPTVGSVEGDEWKRHRKVIMTGFEPSTNATVWKEATRQTQALVERWSEDKNIVSVMKVWTSRLALHVISAVFFEKHLTWSEGTKSETLPAGHKLPFDKAIFQVIESLGILYITPRALLGILPMEGVRKAHLAFTEWTKYLQDLRGDALARVEEISAKKSKSIVEAIVLAARAGDHPLPEDSIFGNIFFTLLAGHETVGNTMAFAFDILALYPEVQSKIHEELDGLLVERPQEEWTIEREYQTLQKGWIGAVIKEVLRLYVPTQWIPRMIMEPINVVDSNGAMHAIPKDTMCLLNFAAAHRNPKTWPQKAFPDGRREALHGSPALDFNPEQWLGSGAIGSPSVEGAVPQHFPFGQGPHVCPGRLFAQVEMVAALATVLGKHSLELVVSEEILNRCNGNQMAARDKTRDQAFRRLFDDVEFNVSLQLSKELPIRLVERI